jgi:hypothetical protein
MKKIIVTMLVCLLAIGIVFANGSKETAAADTT